MNRCLNRLGMEELGIVENTNKLVDGEWSDEVITGSGSR